MDIVYVVKPCTHNDELTLSLRTLQNIPHDKVFIVGGCPRNINKDKVVFIETKQNLSKWQNSTNNLISACQDNRLSEDFILMNDDFFILSPVTEKDLLLDRGPFEDVFSYYAEKYGEDNAYCAGMRQTADLLKKWGFKDIKSFELHIPFLLNKKKFLALMAQPGVRDIKVLHKRTLYGNLYHKNTCTVPDVKILNYFKPNVGKYHNFLSTIDQCFAPAKEWLTARFPKKSKYEI